MNVTAVSSHRACLRDPDAWTWKEVRRLTSSTSVTALIPVPWKVLVAVGCSEKYVILKHRGNVPCPLCKGDGVKWWMIMLSDGTVVEHEAPPGAGSQWISQRHDGT